MKRTADILFNQTRNREDLQLLLDPTRRSLPTGASMRPIGWNMVWWRDWSRRLLGPAGFRFAAGLKAGGKRFHGRTAAFFFLDR